MEVLDLNKKYSQSEAMLNIKPSRHLLRAPFELAKKLAEHFEEYLNDQNFQFERIDLPEGRFQYEICARQGLMSYVGGRQIVYVQFDNFKGWCRAGLSFGRLGAIGGFLKGGFAVVDVMDKVAELIESAVEEATRGLRMPEMRREVLSAKDSYEIVRLV